MSDECQTIQIQTMKSRIKLNLSGREFVFKSIHKHFFRVINKKKKTNECKNCFELRLIIKLSTVLPKYTNC